LAYRRRRHQPAQLSDTERILEWAQENRAARQLEMNERVRKNLINMITALEGGAGDSGNQSDPHEPTTSSTESLAVLAKPSSAV
jgi:hypothetical protein